MNKNSDSKAVTEESGLLKVITSSGLIATFHTNHYLVGFTKSLSRLLLGSSQDILLAYDKIKLVRETLEKEHQTVIEVF